MAHAWLQFAYRTQGGTAGDESRDSHLELAKGEGNLFRSDEWPSLNRFNGWGPKWHGNLTQVIHRSWGIFLILQLLCHTSRAHWLLQQRGPGWLPLGFLWRFAKGYARYTRGQVTGTSGFLRELRVYAEWAKWEW